MAASNTTSSHKPTECKCFKCVTGFANAWVTVKHQKYVN